MHRSSICLILGLVHVLIARPSTIRLNPTEETETDQEAENLPESSIRGFKIGRLRWPNGIVYFQFGADVEIPTRIAMLRAMNALSAATDNSVRFVRDETLQTGVVAIHETGAYVAETNHFETACIAEVGYFPDRIQVLNLSPSFCGNDTDSLLGSAVHELIHTLGFVHEFQRHDRDKYFTLNETFLKELTQTKFGDRPPEEVAYLYQLNFGKANDNTLGYAYNYKSIMNYDMSPLVTPKVDPPAEPFGRPANMGQRCAISAVDRTMISKAYYKTYKRRNGKSYHYYVRYSSHYRLTNQKHCDGKLALMVDELYDTGKNAGD